MQNKLSQLLNDIKQSIKYDYLPEDWHNNKEDIVRTESGYYSLQDSCICIDDCWYNTEQDCDDYFYDELTDEYSDDVNSMCEAYGRRGNTLITSYNNDEVVKFNGDYYIEEYLSDNDIQILHNGRYCHSENARYVESEGEYYHENDVYYWESDDEYHIILIHLQTTQIIQCIK